MQSRRTFIKNTAIWGGALVLAPRLLQGAEKEKIVKLTILYTNDTQGRLEPFPEDAPQYAGLGGMQARADLIKTIRAEQPNVLLLDSGDFFQGSIDFDLFKGRPQIRAMELMGYTAAGMGEHEFDGGIETLVQAARHATFPLLCCNYDFEQSALKGLVSPYHIFETGGLKIGVLGLCPDLRHLLPESVYRKLLYLDPIEKANHTAHYLRRKEKCNFVVCLSQLGLNDQAPINDKVLAKGSRNIDLVIGGHSHTVLQKPLKYFNQDKLEVLVVQAGWGGAYLGRIDYLFSTQKNILSANAQTVEIGK